ncbi:uncharacterized protein PHACADRAFT_166507 [Phanerochaete carnosa HHB-10118-sp]|uniref:F-box domain-containing protein n=1 Tax=Phanerochaete carnosa (strain HHB-10118-sp) TaxID=650164 RepID=K5WI76_PHACS|nr:uncharacterized protein PHACADRAFT_166507 [Phanerochaete carnosa HHB-10118-sp]EKM49932.1 hypothetical protein PHACADRAFT_166507 [Phanerochaete carnosa HHB-10118-sp]
MRTSVSILPVELMEEILQQAWDLPLQRDERIDIWLSLTTVSHTMLNIFIRISMRDVHIMTPAFSRHYLKLVRPRMSFEPDESYLLRNACRVAHRLCRSLTFHIDSRPRSGGGPAEPAIRLYGDGDLAAEAVSNTLYVLGLLPVFGPNLRRVVLQYTDWGFDDVLDQCRLPPMPTQVCTVELRYAFSPRVARLADLARKHYTRPFSLPGMHWQMPQVRTLAVSGAPGAFITAVAQMCPLLERLEVDEYAELDRAWKVPEGLDMLVFEKSAPRVGRVTDWWSVARAVAGDAAATTTQYMLTTLSTPWKDQHVRQRLKRMCLRQNTFIVYA